MTVVKVYGYSWKWRWSKIPRDIKLAFYYRIPPCCAFMFIFDQAFRTYSLSFLRRGALLRGKLDREDMTEDCFVVCGLFHKPNRVSDHTSIEKLGVIK